MTLPRQVVPGRDYMITRRCSERRFFLCPDDDTNNAFLYCLALAATDPSAQEPGDVNEQIDSALQRGHYADAVVLARQAKVSKPESDFAVGEIILQGHTDDRAAQTPRETIEDGLKLIEAAALVGHQQAVSALAATFSTGLSRTGVDSFLLKPDAALSQCWEQTKAKPQKARACMDMRTKR
jgi:hypothetical protein